MDVQNPKANIGNILADGIGMRRGWKGYGSMLAIMPMALLPAVARISIY